MLTSARPWARGLVVAALLLLAIGLRTPLLAEASVSSAVWQWQNPLPQGDNLSAVSCATAGFCTAIGDVGTILTSTDGGVSWISHAAETSQDLTSIRCPSTSFCVAVGRQGGVVTTTDGGASWHLVTGAPYALLAVSCPSTSVCLAAGVYNILKTADGGVSWNYVPYPNFTTNTLSSISCPTTSTCMAVGQDYYGSASGWMTTDGGNSWSAWGPQLPPQTQPWPPLTAVSCATTSVCVVWGQNGTWNTTDGGSTWGSGCGGTCPPLGNESCPTQTFCVLVGTAGVIETSADGGATWTQRSSGSLAALARISCVDTSHCVTVGDAGAVLNTSDGGQHWTNESSGTTAPLFALSCPTASSCVAGGGYNAGVILTTADGGASWTLRATPAGGIQAVSCPDANDCIAVNQDYAGVSSDGGVTWANWTYMGVQAAFRAISCPSPTGCVAVGSGGAIVTTSDFGSHWTTRTSATANWLRDVSCATASLCVAVGDGPTILSSADGGTSWTARTPGIQTGLSGVSCPAATLCLAIGGGTGIFSTDGGSTWTPETLQISSTLRGAACLSDCWAVGDAGAIMFSSQPTTLATVPGAPTNVTASPGDGQASLYWTAPADDGGAPITSYQISAYVGGTLWSSTITGSTAVHIWYMGLTNGTTYTFNVAAINAVGTGTQSLQSNAVTPATVPSAPTSVNGTAGDRSASLTWIAPTNDGGSAITGYRVTPFAGGSAQTPVIFNSTNTTQTITGLSNGTTYTFTAAAINGVGTGPDSAPSGLVILPPSAPGAVSNVHAIGGDGQATVSWTAPTDTGGSVITGYQVTPYLGSVGQSPISTNSTATVQVVGGLTNGKTYTFRVAAENALGVGPDSTSSNPVRLPATAAQSSAGSPGDRSINQSTAGSSSRRGSALQKSSVSTATHPDVVQPSKPSLGSAPRKPTTAQPALRRLPANAVAARARLATNRDSPSQPGGSLLIVVVIALAGIAGARLARHRRD
jgi:photosystem II stability/assembly factor-like uncharacterized protein